jgi:hypothetical protein
MRERCNSANRRDSKYYHDKGITYCDEWNDYDVFWEWAVNNGYAENLTLDRIDGDKPYNPSNCRWITIAEQQRNKSNCLYFEYEGEIKTLTEWSRVFGINRTTLHDRIFQSGLSFEEAIKMKKHNLKNGVTIEFKGKTMNQADFSKLLSVTPQAISCWRKKGLTAEDMFLRAKEINRKRDIR